MMPLATLQNSGAMSMETGIGLMETAIWPSVGAEFDGHWYLMDNNGAVASGWRWYGDRCYYLNANGDMATGWKYLDGAWYWLDGSGAMAQGWRYNGRWFLMHAR